MPTEQDKDAIKELWVRKDEGREMFAQADLLVDVEMDEWDGENRPVEQHSDRRTAKAGSRVLVTMISRFGHVGIRDNRLDEETHGYYGTVDPEKLTNFKFLSDGGVGWRKQFELDKAARAAKNT